MQDTVTGSDQDHNQLRQQKRATINKCQCKACKKSLPCVLISHCDGTACEAWLDGGHQRCCRKNTEETTPDQAKKRAVDCRRRYLTHLLTCLPEGQTVGKWIDLMSSQEAKNVLIILAGGNAWTSQMQTSLNAARRGSQLHPSIKNAILTATAARMRIAQK